MQFKGTDPIFLQIASFYRRLIELGALKDGDMLPSVREVAIENRVNPNTVQRAFAILGEEGYVESIPKKGNFVSYKGNNADIRKNKLKEAISSLMEEGYSKDDILLAIEDLEEGK